MKKKIAFAGSLILDKVYSVSDYPKLGELAHIKDITYSVGGLAANDSIDLKRLSPETEVFAIGRVGADADGDFVVNHIASAGVDVSMIKRDSDSRTSFTDVISIEGGQRTFFTYAGANDRFCYEDIPFDTLECDIMLLGYFLLMAAIDGGDGERILRECSARGIKTAIDLISESSERYSGVRPLLPLVDYLIVNELEAGALAGIEPSEENLPLIAERLRSFGVREKVIIHCPDFGLCLSDEGLTVIPSFNLPKGYIKGTAGAGDAFCSGALLGILQGMSDEEIIKTAQLSAIASLRSADCTSAMEELSRLQQTLGDIPRRTK